MSSNDTIYTPFSRRCGFICDVDHITNRKIFLRSKPLFSRLQLVTRYYIDQRAQKLCTILVTLSYLLPSETLTRDWSGTGTKNEFRMIKKCAGVKGSKSVGSLLSGFIGLELSTASMRYNIVLYSVKVKTCSPITRREWCFTFLIPDS